MRILTIVALSFLMAASLQAAPDELSLRRGLEQRVQTLWNERSMGQLVSIADELLRTRKRTASGIWQLSVFNAAIDDEIEKQASLDGRWDKLLTEQQSWANQFPESPFAAMLPTRVLMLQAWSARGTKLPKRIPATNIAEFRRLLRLAEISLQSVKARASRDPTWYEMSINTSIYLGRPAEAIERVFSEGVARESDFLQLYFVMSRRYDPSWGGSAQSLEAFVRRATDKFEQKRSDSLYARIYWWVSDLQYFSDLKDSMVDCNRLVRGAKTVALDFPDLWNFNKLAVLVGECEDLDAAKYFVARIADRPLPEVWGPGLEGRKRFENFKRWAAQ